jgi:raffinose/stachyose/melibiose transport system substrate-binding protein
MGKQRPLVPLLILAIGTLAGCSTGASASPASSAPSAAANTPATSASSAPTALSVAAWKGGGSELAGLPELNAAFEKAHPDIKLDFKYVSPDYETFVNSRLAAGNAPDVLMADRVKMVKWVKQGYLADLSDQPWVSRMYPNLSFFNSIDGKTYQLNSENIAIGLYTNLDLLTQAGIASAPKTWPEFIADLQTLKAKNLGGFMLANKGGWMGEQFALALAANLVSPDWAGKYDAGQSSFNPDWAPVVNRIKDLFASGTVDPKLMLGLDPNNDGTPQFKAGKAAFMIQGAWAMADIAKSVSFNFAFSTFPGGDAGASPKTFTFVGTGWAVNAKAQSPDAAKQYIDFMAQPENELAYITAEAAYSTLTDVESPGIPPAKPALDSYKAGDTSPSAAQVLNFPDAEVQIQKAIESIFVDPTIDTTKVLQTLDSQIPKTPLS